MGERALGESREEGGLWVCGAFNRLYASLSVNRGVVIALLGPLLGRTFADWGLVYSGSGILCKRDQGQGGRVDEQEDGV